MPKNAYFLEKGFKNFEAHGGSSSESPLAPGAWDSTPRPPRYYSHLLI